MKFYLDTCIWRDYFEDRFSKSGRPLGEHAAKLFLRIVKNHDKILFSESLIWELKNKYTLDEINQMLNLLFHSGVLERIQITKEEFKEAKTLAQKRNIPMVDCLQAIQARNHGAILISQDKHIIENLKDIAKTRRP